MTQSVFFAYYPGQFKPVPKNRNHMQIIAFYHYKNNRVQQHFILGRYVAKNNEALLYDRQCLFTGPWSTCDGMKCPTTGWISVVILFWEWEYIFIQNHRQLDFTKHKGRKQSRRSYEWTDWTIPETSGFGSSSQRRMENRNGVRKISTKLFKFGDSTRRKKYWRFLMKISDRKKMKNQIIVKN